MTDDLRWLEDDDHRDPSPGDLRNLVKKLNDELKTVKGQLEAKDKTIADLSGQVKATSLRDLLAAQGIDPKFAKVAERDGVEATEDAVKQWRQDYDGIYAFKAATPSAERSPEGDAGEGAGDEGANDPGNQSGDLQQQMQAGQNLEGAGHPSGSQTALEALQAAMQNPDQFQDEGQLDAFLQGLGAPTMQSLGGPNKPGQGMGGE